MEGGRSSSSRSTSSPSPSSPLWRHQPPLHLLPPLPCGSKQEAPPPHLSSLAAGRRRPLHLLPPLLLLAAAPSGRRHLPPPLCRRTKGSHPCFNFLSSLEAPSVLDESSGEFLYLGLNGRRSIKGIKDQVPTTKKFWKSRGHRGFEVELKRIPTTTRSEERSHQRSPDRCPITTDPNFEFRGASPPSPSPADLFFSNGQLQPHTFPLSGTKTGGSTSSSRSSSANRRTDISYSGSDGRGRRKSGERAAAESGGARVVVKVQPATAELRWQYVGEVGPRLVSSSSQRGSRREVRTSAVPPEGRRYKKEEVKSRGFWGSCMSACQTCHAIEPSKHVEKWG